VPWGFAGLALSALALARLGEAWRTDELGLGELLAGATTARSPGGAPEHRTYGRMSWVDRVDVPPRSSPVGTPVSTCWWSRAPGSPW
jgi:hypothetical protein